MIPTYVFGWPSGQESGNYLAVDLGEYCCARSILRMSQTTRALARGL